MQMRFYTPAHGVSEEFGAATLGFAGAEDETAIHSLLSSFDLKGTVVYGSYGECLAKIPEGNWKAGIVLLGNCGRENWFVQTLAQKLQIPLVGGSGAINPMTGEKKLLYGRSEAAIFLIDDERYEFEVCCKNIHHTVLSEHEITFLDPRRMDAIDGSIPHEWLCKKKKELGLDPEDYEHLTLADEYGVNVHLSCVDGEIFSGRDLSERMYLRYIPKEEVQAEIQSFYDDKDAIIFGCAGLKQILTQGLRTEGLGLFMFGEVCTTTENHSDFGNLMLSKLRIKGVSNETI